MKFQNLIDETYSNTCSNCNTGISGGSGLGRCIRCSKLAKFSDLQCPCGVPIGRNNKSGLCLKCRVKRDRKAGKKSNFQDVSSQIRRHKTGKWTTCHMPGCDEYFELRKGQHPAMSWCDKCRKTPGYKNYGAYTSMTRGMKA